MSPQTLSSATARDVMEVANTTAVPGDSAASALEVMEAQDLPLLPVVDPDTGRFLGAVLRKALQNGCIRMGHDASTCKLEKHLNRNVPSCREDDDVYGGLEAQLRRSHVVVLDAAEAPLGFIRAAAR